ncbi:GNAT family N-acetyltransferase [Sulfolobus sp. S-194]|uniref:GNAT family N-acetyltransferase n=1 Tax=Sulfolobus sp. S-194 TaxID=2512240 RepID=UPI001436FFFE|nr:GNAT family N-acetyltransferase [Sulfolobus sp. S-194]QIW22788.1 GNAT family N-acetyltransferase [Sulfolobus sp. S-194]
MIDIQLKKLFLRDPIKFAFEIYDSEIDYEFSEFKIVNEGYFMIYRKFNPVIIILYAENEATVTKLLSLIKEDKFVLFIEPKWKYLLNFSNMKIYPEIIMICKSPSVFRREDVRRLTAEDSDKIIELYGKDRGGLIVQMLRDNKTTAYGLFLGNKLVSAAYTWIETKDVGIIGGVFTREEFRNRGFASSVVSELAEDIVNRGKIASLYVREDNTSAIHVYRKIGFNEYWKRLWVSVNTDAKPL